MPFSDRWIPVLAAVVGVLGGMGGAVIGGTIANRGQAERLEFEEQSEQRDVRRETYATFLAQADSLLTTWLLKFDEEQPSEDEARKFLIEEGISFVTALSAVDLVAGEDVRAAAKAIDEGFATQIKSESEWEELRSNFIEAAAQDIRPNQ